MAYRGMIVEVPLGTDGLTGTSNVTNVPPGYLQEATNCSLSEGNLRKEGGATLYNSSAITGAPRVLGGTDWYTDDLSQRMVIACDDGKLYKDSGAGTFPVTLKSGLSADMNPVFVHGGSEDSGESTKLFIFTGTNVVQVLTNDGATTTDISTPAADWTGSAQPTFGFIYNFRLLAGGNSSDPHRIYYSTTTNQEDFTGSGAGSVSVYPGEGSAIVGGVSFNNYALIFKRPRGVYAIDMRSATAANWTVQRISSVVSLASPTAIVPTDIDVFFIDSAGSVQALSNSLSNIDVETRNVGQGAYMDPLVREDMNFDLIDRIQGVYYPRKREVHFTYASAGASENDRRLVLDLFRPDKIRFRLSTRDVCESIWTRIGDDGLSELVAGDAAGFVWQLDQNTATKNGSAYATTITTVPTNLEYHDPLLRDRVKNFAFLELVYEPLFDTTVDVEVVFDGTQTQTLSFSLDSPGATLGTFLIDTDVLGAGGFASAIKRLPGSGKYVQLTFSHNDTSGSFAINRAFLYLKPGKN